MIDQITAARSMLASAQELTDQAQIYPTTARPLHAAAALLIGATITELQAALATRFATTLGVLDNFGASAGASPQTTQRAARATPVEGGSDAADNGQGGEPAPTAAKPTTTEPAVWTQARCALLRQAVPRGDEWDAIMAALNALPARFAVASAGAAGVKASQMGLRRPAGWTQAHQTEAGRKGGLARVANGTPLPGHHSPNWNAERDAVVLHHWPAGTPSADILAMVNAIPHGQPVANLSRLAERAEKLGVARSAEYLASLRAASAAAMVAAKPVVWTEERLAMLGALRGTAVAPGDLLARINALPGGPVASVEALAIKARRSGVVLRQHKPRVSIAPTPEAAEQTADAPAKPDAADEPEADEEAEDPADELPPLVIPARPPAAPLTAAEAARQEQAEIFGCFEAGQTVRLVAEEFRIGINAAANHHSAWRASRAVSVA